MSLNTEKTEKEFKRAMTECRTVFAGKLKDYGASWRIIQLDRGFADHVDMEPDEAMKLYDRYATETYDLMLRKNHDYGEAWRDMRVSSYTDLILTKIERIKEIEDNDGKTTVSEGIASNYMDIINYSVFGIIRLSDDSAAAISDAKK